MFKNALVSTSNKEGLAEFLLPLAKNGCRIVSTGGTSTFLKTKGIKVVEVAEQTGFPEVMDGRVRTLHPSIHMPILARQNEKEDFALLKQHGLEPFDLVIVNLYPFAEARAKNLPEDELIEYIDIGGPSLLRAASKNFERIAVVCDPSDYSWILAKNELTLADRKKLAAKVFSHTASYDAMIAETMTAEHESATVQGELVQELRYGENQQQKAWWYRREAIGLHKAKILHGKALSYNNLLDLNAAVGVVRELEGVAMVAVKHNSPCGAASGKDAFEVTQKALAADPVSVFGGIVAANFEITETSAEKLAKIFLECIVAPSFSEKALEILTKKKDLRLLQFDCKSEVASGNEIRSIDGGFLMQTRDHTDTWQSGWKVLGPAPDAETKNDLILAWKVCAHLKSNAIAVAGGAQTLGLGMGQVNRVDSVKHAIERAQNHHPQLLKKGVLASDAFFPFADSIDLIHQAGIKWVIQPGGSIRDNEVFERAQKLGVQMVITERRHFKH